MVIIVLGTIIGFLIGLVYVIIKRRIKPGALIAAALVGLVSASLWKAFQGYGKSRRPRR